MVRRLTIMVTVLLVTGAAAAACTDDARRAHPARDVPTSVCRGRVTQPVRHVVWIWMENRAADEVYGSRFMRTRRAYIDGCARFTALSAVQHASLGNYIAAATGRADGVRAGCAPAACPIDRPSIFGQVTASGREWRSYAESSPSRCAPHDSGSYLVRHDPAPYLVRERRECRRWDVALGSRSTGAFAHDLRAATLPALASISPNRFHDGHDGSSAEADRWLRNWLDAITASNAWRRGDVAVFVVWDEGRRSRAPGVRVNDPCPRQQLRGDCHIAGFVVAPGVRPATTIDTRVDLVDLTQLTQHLLQLSPPLGTNRRSARRLASQLGLALTP